MNKMSAYVFFLMKYQENCGFEGSGVLREVTPQPELSALGKLMSQSSP